ncbi:DEAD/DEAH box helicase [Geodermatophilus sp. CPCC 205761]|uniref:DEAD/DEAH box helicase n=1 Tax=Geodermatophilus sp. CPCC 205761 TaxID=2936597 RepID=UPI003EED5830
MNTSDWAGLDSPLAKHVREQSERCLAAYRENPLLVAQDGAIEISTAEGGYGRKQLYELIQNGADALVGRTGRISVVLMNDTLYCANQGAPLTPEGVDALMTSHLSVKRGTEIGRFGLGFKSVVGVSSAPQVFSRFGSFGFDRAASRERIERIVPYAEKYPTLRLAEALDPMREAAHDEVLSSLMTWADTVVKLPLLPGSDWLSTDVQDFPGEFLLFSPHVTQLELHHLEEMFTKEVRATTRADGAVVLDEAGTRTAYHVFRRVHRPSPRAQQDAGEQARREEIPVVWAVPERSRSRLGSFWAFFPTASKTTLSGIVNAPWKTNEDRHDLLEGAFNKEILTTVLPAMVARGLPSLVDPADPAGFLDVLPARGREHRSWADDVINDAVFKSVATVNCLPDSHGELGSAERLKLHPKDLRTEWLEAWAECPTRPKDWVHHTVDKNHERRLKAERLVTQAAPRPRELAEWLEALSNDKHLVGAASAVVLAARIVADEPGLESAVREAAVVLTGDGQLAPIVRGGLFLPTEGLEAGGDLAFVHPDLMAFPGVEDALRRLGISTVDQSGLLRALVRQDRDDWDDDRWTRFWLTSRSVDPSVAAGIIREELGDQVASIEVRTLVGRRAALWDTYLPGPVIPADRSRDAVYAVDLAWHRDDRPLLSLLGASAGPSLHPDRQREDWLEDYEKWAVRRYYELLPRGGPRPAEGYLRVYTGTVPDPIGLLPDLSRSGQAALTRAALDLGPEQDRTVAHATVAHYPRLEVLGPLTWYLSRNGVVETALGPTSVSHALAPDEQVKDVLPVAHVTREEAERLGLRRGTADISDREWQRFLQDACEWNDDARRSKLYAIASQHTSAPESLHVRLGQRVVEVHTEDVYVVDDEREYGALLAQSIPVLLVADAEHTTRLVDAWGLLDGSTLLATEVAFTAAGEAGPLVDRFPPLRLYLPPDLESLELVPCQDIQVSTVTPAGRSTEYRDFLLHEGRVHAVLGTDTALLRRLSEELDLDLSDSDVDHVIRQTEDHAARSKAAAIRTAADDDERLLMAVGEVALRRSIPQLALSSLEADGTRLDGPELAEIARAVHGISVLSKLRQGLADQGLEPPERWAGSSKARRFVTDLGFSSDFAGMPAASRPSLMEVDGPAPLPPLHDYQERVLDQTRALLRGQGPSRGLISLPTGAGKTRVAVEALVRHVREEGLTGPVLWIAQSDELCEQAVQTWSFVWRAEGPPERLRISRLWGDNGASRVDDGFHLVVAIDDKLSSILDRDEYAWLKEAEVVVVDEAHTSISPTYTRLLEWLGRGRARRQRPLIGLTATPFRGVSEDETSRLVARYDDNRLDRTAFGDVDPYTALQDRRILARVQHRLLEGADVQLTRAELDEMRTFRRVPRQLETRLGADRDRNEVIVRSIIDLPQDWTVLLFASSVENAETLAAMLAVQGVPAVAISGGTDPAERRYYVERFRKGDIRVITNYAVLAQGFDAPAVRAVYVTRPTFSPNVYQQMIGRGLRGHHNGGSDEVLIVNVQDNFDQFGERLAFYDFEYLWSGAARG